MTKRQERIKELSDEEKRVLKREHAIKEHVCPVCMGKGEVPEEVEEGEIGDMEICEECDGYGVTSFWDTLREFRAQSNSKRA